ncbi:MAG: 16S rRNA (adenine(1518)-N(6)/adenine(1519)-N(6))-dimethyltransferase RsmA [Fastidiosipilaceae bacterium]|jgi:16S rRNA (adenine1518-N6/adenine1519-N6)-dimethyltransferase
MMSRDPFEDLSLRELLRRYNISLNQNLGQNFLHSREVLRQIVQIANVNEADTVIEVGAGAGTLTAELAQTGAEIVSLELDHKLEPLLRDRFASFANVRLRFEDALRADLGNIKQEGRPLKIVANIPYYITTPLLEHFLLSCPDAACVVLTIQKEVAENLLKRAGKEYGPVNVLAHLQGAVSMEFIVPPHLFTPPPAVTSAVVSIKARGRSAEPEIRSFYRFVKTCFRQRRKTLLNNVKGLGQSSYEQIRQYLQVSGIELSIRPEQISPEQYLSLYKCLKKCLNKE